jgi:transposase
LGIKSLTWPGNSPDLNIIENLWAILKRKVRARNPKTLWELENTIMEAWEKDISPDIIKNLFNSMPRRIKAVIKSKGGITKY